MWESGAVRSLVAGSLLAVAFAAGWEGLNRLSLWGPAGILERLAWPWSCPYLFALAGFLIGLLGRPGLEYWASLAKSKQASETHV